MPRKEDIEQFNQELIKLGNEPGIVRQRDEIIEPILDPETYPVDHNGPLARVRKAPVAQGNDAAAVPAGTPAPVASAFDDLFGDLEAADDSPPPEEAEAPAPFDDLFDDSIFSSPTLPDESEATDDAEDLGGIPFDLGDYSDPDAHTDSDAPGELGDISDLGEANDLGDASDLPPPLDGFGDLGSLDSSPPDFNLGDPFESLDAEDHEDTPIPSPEADVDPFAGLSLDSPAPADEAGEVESSDPFGDLDDFGDLVGSDSSAEDMDDLGPPLDEADDLGIPTDIDRSEAFGDTDSFGASNDFASTDDFAGTDDFASPEDFGNLDMASADEVEPAVLDDPFAGAETTSSPDGLDAMPDFATDLETDFGTDDFPAEFSMGDFEKEFGVLDEVKAKDQWATPDMAAINEVVEEAVAATAADEAKGYQVSADDFSLIRQSLGAMPLNLRIATEEVLGDPSKPFPDIKALIELLIAGESPNTLAPVVSKLTGKKIKIPPGYTRKTGKAFEDEKNSFAYRFRETILPLIRTAALALASLAGVAWLGFTFIITPLVANGLYREGLAAIADGDYARGNQKFNEAYAKWPVNDRHLDYAQAFTDQGQFSLAYQKYKQLLGDSDPRELPPKIPAATREYQLNERYPQLMNQSLPFSKGREPTHRRGILAFATFMVDQYAPPAGSFAQKYEEAIIYLERLLRREPWDQEAMLLQGDTYMAWAAWLDDPRAPDPSAGLLAGRVIYSSPPPQTANENLDPAIRARNQDLLRRIAELHEGARFNYARLINAYGSTDLLESKMLRYFMRSGKREEAELIAFRFMNQEKLSADPEIIAELAGNLITQAQGDLILLDQVNKLLRKLLDKGEENPRLYYQASRYYRYLRDNLGEERVLANTLLSYRNREEQRPFTREELTEYLDTLIRAGENAHWLGKALAATEFLEEARTRYEEAILARKIPVRAALFGRLYAVLGDVAFYKKDPDNPTNLRYLEEAERWYARAAENQYGVNPMEIALVRPYPPEDAVWEAYQTISYKRGYIAYYRARAEGVSPEVRNAYLQVAARFFLNAQGRVVNANPNLHLALGNTLTEMGNHESAVSQYRILYQDLLDMRRGITPFDPASRLSHRELIELQFTTANNLGVALYRLYRTGGLRTDEILSQAQYYLSEATTLGQNIDRDIETGIRSMAVRSAYLNMDRVLAPLPRDDVYIIPDLKTDLAMGLIGNL